ncbi:MAG: hypothetical protein KDC14_03050 [Planctomycetes bacterium]|nr:hypothetical protein [Planctomycetota bacterium]
MDRYLKRLRVSAQSNLQSAAGRQWFQRVGARREALGRFGKHEELLGFFEQRPKESTGFAARDEILRALLDEHRAGPDPHRSHDVFLIIYYPLLVRLAREFGPDAKGKSLDEEETAPEIVHAFFHLLATLNPETNRDIHTSLVNGTRRDFLRWAGPEFEHSNETCPPPELKGDEEPAVLAAPSFTFRDLSGGRVRATSSDGGWELDLSEVVLDELRRRKVIDEHVHFLLIGTVVYRRQLKELVTTAGPGGKRLGYEAAKKRLQRAQDQIQRYLREHELDLTDLARDGLSISSAPDVPPPAEPGSGGSKGGK